LEPLDAQVPKLHRDARMVLLKADHAAREPVQVAVLHHFAVDGDLDVRAAGADFEGVPALFGSDFAHPLQIGGHAVVDAACGVAGVLQANLHLVAVVPRGGGALGAEKDAAVALGGVALVNPVFAAQDEVLVFVGGADPACAVGGSDEFTVLHAPVRACVHLPAAQVAPVKQRSEPLASLLRRQPLRIQRRRQTQ
jgi:hypothetical protein